MRLLILPLLPLALLLGGCRSPKAPEPFDRQSFWQEQEVGLNSAVSQFRSDTTARRSEYRDFQARKREFLLNPPPPIDLTEGR